MRLKIIGGTLEVEVVDGLTDIRKILKDIATQDETQVKESIKNAGKPQPKKTDVRPYVGRLPITHKMPI